MRTRPVLVMLLLCVAFAVQAESFGLETSAVDAARINARLGIEYLKQGQLAVARDKIEKALQQNPRDVSVQMSAGLLYEQMLQPDQAEKHYREALHLEADNPEAQNAFGAFLCRNGQAKRGEELFVKAAHNPLYQTPAVALTNAGVCARRNGRLDKSEEYLRQAIELPALYPEALVQMAGVSFERGKYLQARAFLGRYLAVAPGGPSVMLLGYQVEKALGDATAMLGYEQRLRREFPDSPEARVLDQPPAGPAQ